MIEKHKSQLEEKNENDVLEKNPDEEDGLKNVNEVQHEQIETNEGWGGWDEELATPTPDKMVIVESVQEKRTLKMGWIWSRHNTRRFSSSSKLEDF